MEAASETNINETTPEEFSAGFDAPDKEKTFAKTIGKSIGKAIKDKGTEPKKDYSFTKKWALIRLEQRRTESDIVDVPVMVNGKLIMLQRGKWTPVNWVYVLALRDAKHPVYKDKPGEPRKLVGQFTRFPFQGPYEITESEFKSLRKIAIERDLTAADIPERHRGLMTFED